jgi:hypothetical protein
MWSLVSPSFTKSIHNFRDWCCHLAKTNFGPTGHHYSRNISLSPVCNVPSTSVIFKCVLKVVFCEGVQHRLRFCLDHLNCVKTAAFQFYVQSGKQKSRVGRGRQSFCFGRKFSDGKGSVRRRVVVKQLEILSPKFGVMSSHIFTQSP